MWIYNKSKENYKIQWGDKTYNLIPNRYVEIDNDVALAYFGYGYGANREIDEKEAKYLVKILLQRWQLAGVKATEDFLEYNIPDKSVFWLSDKLEDLKAMTGANTDVKSK